MNIDESSTANKKYWQKLRILSERATRDFLSGLLNRVTATQYIQDCLKAMPLDESCALFIIDLDHFKQVNDTFGHQVGDKIIRQAAALLSQCFRVTDIVGRLGGDEFFALLAGHVTREMVEIQTEIKKICIQSGILDKLEREKKEKPEVIKSQEISSYEELDEQPAINPQVMEFLDLYTMEERFDYLKHKMNWREITEKDLDIMAVSVDIVLKENEISDKINDLVHCVEQFAQWEINGKRR